MTSAHEGPLRIGTRASALALAQSGMVGRLLTGAEMGADGSDESFALVHVSTQGDQDRESRLSQIGGTGVFVTAVRDALLAGEVDAIVHSCKDLPTAPADGIALACIPEREDVRDALCARDGLTLEDLPEGASVGTGSPRRGAQLLRHRPDLRIVPIRGNIDTRLARAQGPDADLDAVILAAAGLRRLGKEDAITEVLDPAIMLPAPAQGALAVEVREADAESGSLGAALFRADDPLARAAVTAERSLLRTLEAGCSAPVAALGHVADSMLHLQALAISEDGTHCVEATRRAKLDLASGREARDAVAVELGAQLARELIEQGADTILEEAR